ncbi:phosphatase PAP2 family protein [Pseudorhodoferax sp.]|uniref:phosphatase PAP2 family protein n=1 Tax=Pseudorhodoferax sp. TaxID=1993553 RepID=UPI002DD69095|nr:phosphatase PAP2 family protein [Pseudorhodoferax sp.]
MPPIARPPLPLTTAQPAGWAHTLARRWWHLQWLKLLGIGVWTWLFFVVYFALLREPAAAVTTMPLTPLDGWFGFHPEALWPYLSLWVYVGIAPALQPTLRTLLAYGIWTGLLCVLGLLCFYYWPTTVPPQAHHIDAALAGNPGLALLRGVDAAGNACPSMHVAMAVFSGRWLQRQLAAVGAPRWPRLASAAWLLAIVWSTLALRQHVVLDVVAGALLGLAVAEAALRWGSAHRADAMRQARRL